MPLLSATQRRNLWLFPSEKLDELMDTPSGKIYIVVGEPND